MRVTKQPERAVWRTGGALFVAQVVSGGLGVLAWLLAAFNYSAQEVGTALALVGALSWAGLTAPRVPAAATATAGPRTRRPSSS